jgi:hypothetical protein
MKMTPSAASVTARCASAFGCIAAIMDRPLPAAKGTGKRP